MGVTFVAILPALVSSILAAGDTTVEANASLLILSGQEPKTQDILPGGDAEFTITLQNTGTVSLEAVSVTGATTASCNRDNLGALAPGQTTSYQCGATDIDKSFLNVLQANGINGDSTVSHTSNAFVKVLNQDISITKIPLSQTVVQGGTAQFDITITNISGTYLSQVRVDDNVVNDCDVTSFGITLGPDDQLEYECFLDDVQSPLTSITVVEAVNLAEGRIATVSDAGWIELLKLQATLTPQPSSVPEPGDLIKFTVDLVNAGSKELTLVSLTTTQFGNLLDPNNPLLDPAQNTCLPQGPAPTLPPHGGSYSCTFEASVNGQPSNFNVNLTATAKDKNNKIATATAIGAVIITNQPASLDLSLSAEPPFINPPSRPVTFKIQVANTSEADFLTITELEDQFLGNLDGKGTCNLPVAALAPSASYQCEFVATVSGQVGDEKSRTISVTAIDDDTPPNTLIASEVVTVGVTSMPPQAVFVPNVTEDTVEPNKSCAQAYPLVLNRAYYFLPPAVYPNDQDYFSFELVANSRVRVELSNFLPQAGQILVRSGDGCTFVEGKNGTVAVTKTVDLGLKPAGKYYIQVINDNNSQVFTDMYSLIVRLY
jgi:hypothetical protein